jgi:hypothetical protein
VQERTIKELSLGLAEELGVHPDVIVKAVRALGRKIPWVQASNDGRPGRGLRLYDPSAVPAIRRWVEDWKRERIRRAPAPAPAKFWLKIQSLENAVLRMERALGDVAKGAEQIREVCGSLRDLPPIATSITVLEDGFTVAAPPLPVMVRPLRGSWSAALLDAPLCAEGESPEAAVAALRRAVVSTYLQLSAEPHQENHQLLAALRQLIQPSTKGA